MKLYNNDEEVNAYDDGYDEGYKNGFADGWEEAKEELIRCMHLLELVDYHKNNTGE